MSGQYSADVRAILTADHGWTTGGNFGLLRDSDGNTATVADDDGYSVISVERAATGWVNVVEGSTTLPAEHSASIILRLASGEITFGEGTER